MIFVVAVDVSETGTRRPLCSGRPGVSQTQPGHKRPWMSMVAYAVFVSAVVAAAFVRRDHCLHCVGGLLCHGQLAGRAL